MTIQDKNMKETSLPKRFNNKFEITEYNTSQKNESYIYQYIFCKKYYDKCSKIQEFKNNKRKYYWDE